MGEGMEKSNVVESVDEKTVPTQAPRATELRNLSVIREMTTEESMQVEKLVPRHEHVVEKASDQSANPKSLASPSKPRHQTILLVDDDPITNYMNSRLLQTLQAAEHIEVTTNGAEALAFLESERGRGQHAPSLILLDINMPVMDGFEFLEAYQLRLSEETISESSGAPWPLPLICVLTTSTSPTDTDRLKEYPEVCALIKPLTAESLADLL